MTPTISSELKEGRKISSRMFKNSPSPSRSLFATVTSSTTNCPTISSGLINNNVSSRVVQINRRRMDEDYSEIPNKRQRRRQLSTTSSSELSSTSANYIEYGDGYGTDSELVTINKNRDDFCESSCKCSTLDPLSDYEDDGFHSTVGEICVNRVSSTISPINFTTNTSSNSNSYIANHFNQRQILNVHKLNKLLSSDHYENIMERVSRTTEKITNASTKNLFDITIRTIKLIKRNQELHTKLSELQSDTKIFFESIMENPENQNLKNQCKSIEE